ncbi:hypothetical protein V502_00850 [Pseudogymnoascus sp. VKM F-4520 (FW-2644)]|nr:hypothetical protein V502_00850 [Pseudogymnoascus sp. VKM F-4520 (FW-2644)]
METDDARDGGGITPLSFPRRQALQWESGQGSSSAEPILSCCHSGRMESLTIEGQRDTSFMIKDQGASLRIQSRGMCVTVDLASHSEMSDFPAGSPEFIISMITFCKELLENPNSSIVRPVVYVCIEDFIPTAYKYEGDIQLETIQLALDQITSLGQDGNLPEYVQGILNDIKLFYEGGDKRDGKACALKGGRSLVIISKF